MLSKFIFDDDYSKRGLNLMRKVLFVCIHNSARSQMAEAFVNSLCSEELQAQSAGIEPGELNPLAVEVMREIGIDLSGKLTRGVFDLFKSGERFDYVVTVCDEASAERCPIFPGVAKRLHWSFPDPSTFTGSWEERLERTRAVRDAVRERVSAWCADACRAHTPAVG